MDSPSQSPTRSKTQKALRIKTLASSSSKDLPANSPSPIRGDTTTKSFYFPQRTLGFSQTFSASTLQHSSVSWGFGTGSRFPPVRNLTEFKYLDSSTLDKKATSFGYGTKSVMLESSIKRTAAVPGPNTYRLSSDFDNKNKGKSFGLSFAAYAKTYVPGCTTMPPELARQFPGPGTYYSYRSLEPKKPRITIKPRLKMFNEYVSHDTPPSSKYTPVEKLVTPSRFRNITFGFGTKHDFTKALNQNPGPGSYRIASCFDKPTPKKKMIKYNRKAL